MSKNPFASALSQLEDKPRAQTPTHSSRAPPRPPKPSQKQPPPPSYEEAAGPEAAKKSYPREKEGRSEDSRERRRENSRSGHSRENGHSSHSRSHGREHGRGSDRDKDRERRSHRSKKSPSKKKSDPVKPKNLDTIDKLDVTGFVGFHHDGPFDACAPHRNIKKEKAPVMAFPIDGPNNSIAGGTNMTKDDQLNLAFGNYHEETPVIKTNRTQNDPTSSIYTPKQNPSVINFDSNTNSTPIHGSTTAGLGSTTFLDGAPAPKGDELLNPNAGVGRKKSIVQRLRKNSGSESNSRRSSNEGLQPPSPPYQEPRRGSLNTLELDNDDNELKPPGNSFIRRVRSLKVRK